MAPLIVLTVTFIALLAVGRGRWAWYTSLRVALAAMFLLTAYAHFGVFRDDLVRMVPPVFPRPELIVTLTGVLEILGALGLLIPRTAPYAGTGLTLLLLAMFPANVHAALEQISFDGGPATPLLPRTLLQLLFIASTLAATAPHRLGQLLVRRKSGGQGRSSAPQSNAAPFGRVSPSKSSGTSGARSAP